MFRFLTAFYIDASNKVIHESVDKYLQINEPQSSEKRLSREDALSSVRKSKIFADDKLLLFLQDLSSQRMIKLYYFYYFLLLLFLIDCHLVCYVVCHLACRYIAA